MKECIDYFKDKILDKLPVKVFIAGGAIRDFMMYKKLLDENDIDLYSDNQGSLDTLIRFLDRNSDSGRLYSSDYAHGYLFNSTKVDIIYYNIFDSLEDIIKGFDFTVCCAALDNTRFVSHDKFYDDVLSREIRLNDTKEALEAMKKDASVLKRLQKYILKGFTASDSTLLEIANMLSEVPKDSIKIKGYDSNKKQRAPRFRPRQQARLEDIFAARAERIEEPVIEVEIDNVRADQERENLQIEDDFIHDELIQEAPIVEDIEARHMIWDFEARRARFETIEEVQARLHAELVLPQPQINPI